MGLLDQAVARMKQEQANQPAPAAEAASGDVDSEHAERQPAGSQPELAAPSGEEARQTEARRAAGTAGGRVQIDGVALAQKGFLIPGRQTDRALLDEYRRIKRGLLANASADPRDLHPDQAELPRNLVMVTSAVAGEGKTFTAVNLALSLSQEFDRRVLLVDGDVMRRGASHVFGVNEHAGLVDFLATDDYAFEDLVVEVDGIDKLQVLPAGNTHPHAEELFASERMRDWLLLLAEQAPDLIVIFDTSPLLMTSEVGALSAHMGQIALVVRADSTSKHSVEQALGEIQPERFAGLILNGASRKLAAGATSEYYYE